jgi:hypothetical protein
MASTYESIATYTLNGSSTLVTFSSIPQTFTDLVIIASYAGTSNGINIYPNGDGSSNKSATVLRGNGSSSESLRASSIAFRDYWTTTTNSTGEFTVSTLHLNSYSNSTTYKTLLARRSISSAYVEVIINTWQSTAAITQLQLYSASGNYAAGSTITLYGIKAA